MNNENNEHGSLGSELELRCCFSGCSQKAVYSIIDTNERRYDVAETFACEDHLGLIIGSVIPTEPKGPWTVSLL